MPPEQLVSPAPKKLVVLAVLAKRLVVEAPLDTERLSALTVPVALIEKSVVVAPLMVVEEITSALGNCCDVDATKRPSHVPLKGVEVPWMVWPSSTVFPDAVSEPKDAAAPKRLVDEAVVLNTLVVVALVVVEFDASKLTKCEVDDAWRPAWNQTGVFVATAIAP